MDPLSLFLWFTAALTVAGALFCLAIRGQMRRAVGASRHDNCPVVRARGGYTLLVIAASIAFFASGATLMLPAVVTLVAGLAITWLRPGSDDHVFGTEGVRRGWFARRFDELDEWRLTGEHLRWKLRGEWQAVSVPAERREGLRGVLESVAADRESRFRH